MKNQRQPSDSHFGPRSHMSSSREKQNVWFRSQPMKKSKNKSREAWQVCDQSLEIELNTNRRDNGVANNAHIHSSKTSDSSNKASEKDRRLKAVSPTQQILAKDSNVMRLKTLTLNENLLPMAKSTSKSNHELAPLSKDLKQPTTSRLDNRTISLSKNIKRVNPSGLKGEFSSKKLEKPTPLWLEDGSNATLECSKKLHLSEVEEGSVRNSNNFEGSTSRLNRLKAMPGLFHKAKNANALNQCNNFLGSSSRGRSNPGQTEDNVVRKGNIEMLKSLKGKEVVTILEGSNISIAKELLVLNKESSNEDEKCQDEIMTDKGKEIRDHTSVVCDDHHKKEDLLNAKEGPNSSSALMGNQVMQDLRRNSVNISFPIFGKDISSHQRTEASCMDDIMERNGDPSDRCLQLYSRNQNTKFERKRTEPLPEEKPKTHDDDTEQAKNSRSIKKQRRYIETNEEVEAGVEDGTAGLASQIAILKDRNAKVFMPFVSESVKQRPIDEPIWSGIFKIDSKEYVSLAAHLSTKSCEKVWKSTRSLLPVVEVTKLSKSEAWPERWEASSPTEDDIGLYFFSHNMRPDEDLDKLAKEVMENDIVLRAVIGEAEMLIFPSILLPEQYQTFQRKHYLWGLFKRRTDVVAIVEEHNGTGRSAQEEELEKQHASHQQYEVQCEESDQETLMERAVQLKLQLVGTHRGAEEGVEASTQQVKASCVPGPNMDIDLRAHEEEKKQHVDKESTSSLAGSNAQRLAEHTSEATSVPTTADTISTNHGQIHSSLVPPGQIFGTGVFKHRTDVVAVEEEHNGSAQEEEMEKQHASHQQDEVQCEESDQETLMERAMRLKTQQLMGTHRGAEKEGIEASIQQVEASCVPGPNMDIDLQAREEEGKRQHVDQESTPSLAGSIALRLAECTAEATSAPLTAATIPTNHGQIHSSLGVAPGIIFGFVVRRTPRLEQLIQEMEREGALVVAMHGMIGSGLGQAAAME